jgi:hypothetical protein
VSIQSRPSPAIEAICYFCAAELLANVAQHAQASRASLSCAQHGPWLRIVVRDDGRGGATINRVGSSSSGLAGLADRVGAVDGHLSIASPPGGPTAVTVDLPSTPEHGAADAIRVVIAEDSAILRDGLVQLLTDRGFAVSGRSAMPSAWSKRLLPIPPTWPWSISACRRRSPTRGCGPPSRLRRITPAWGSWCSPNTSRPATRPSCWPAARPGSATCSRTGSPTSPTSWRPWCGWRREAPPSTQRW